MMDFYDFVSNGAMDDGRFRWVYPESSRGVERSNLLLSDQRSLLWRRWLLSARGVTSEERGEVNNQRGE